MVWNPNKPWNGRNKWRFRRTARKLPARAIPKSIARVRKEWVTIYNPMEQAGCRPLIAPWSPVGDSCWSRLAIHVLDPVTLSETYQDNVKISAMKGSIFMRPLFQRPSVCDANEWTQWINAVRDSFIRCRVGLYKQETIAANPVGQTPDLGGDVDYSDTPLLKEWVRNWPSVPYKLQVPWYGENTFMGVCNDTTRDSYITPATSTGSQPAFQVPEIETICREFTGTNETCLAGPVNVFAQEHGWKSISLNRRRDIVMKEEMDLSYVFAWANIVRDAEMQPSCGTSTWAAPCALQIIPDLKVQICYG